jgi:hypothetical protein
MKSKLRNALALAGMTLLAAPTPGRAEVRLVELDVTGYLCGL